MPANASPEFGHAEKMFDEAKTDEEKIFALEEMLRTMPQHKSAESLRSNLRTRYKKLKEKIETRGKKSGGGNRQTIKKDDMQLVIAGFTNTGKTSLFNILTQQNLITTEIAYSTSTINLGTTKFEDVKIQTIDMPAFPNEDKSIINTTDTILITIDDLKQIELSKEYLKKSIAKIIFIYTKSDILSETEKRKLSATLSSKYKNINCIVFSSIKHTKEELNHLKKTVFQTFPIIRIYTKEPKKEPSKTPMILEKDATAKDVAEKIIKGMSGKIKKTKIWGPSSKFPGQQIGQDHTLKDKDIIEFQTE